MKNGVRLVPSPMGNVTGVIRPRRLIKSDVKAISEEEKRKAVPISMAICSLDSRCLDCWKSNSRASFRSM
ncbi:hypothetical protein D3C76_1774600 [compost metagenome]